MAAVKVWDDDRGVGRGRGVALGVTLGVPVGVAVAVAVRRWSGSAAPGYRQSNGYCDQGTHRVVASDTNVGVVCSDSQFARIHLDSYFLVITRRDIARSRA